MKLSGPSPAYRTALRCWVQGRRIYLETEHGRTVSFPASKYASLDQASQADLAQVSLNPLSDTLRWESLDEQILIEDVAANRFVRTPRVVIAAVK